MPGVTSVVEISNGIAVIASNSWYAMRAAEAVECDWAAGDYPPDQAGHFDWTARLLSGNQSLSQIIAGFTGSAEFQARYAAEVLQQPALFQQLRGLAQQGRITLVYAARDTDHNEAVVLRNLLLD